MSIYDCYDNAHGSVRESLRTLYSNIQFSRIGQSMRAVAITSTVPQEGKSTMCCLLGMAIARMNKRVLLVEMDLHRPQLASYLGKRCRRGIADYVTNAHITFSDVLADAEVAGLYYVDSGLAIPNPSEIVNAPRFAHFIAQAKANFDFVIFDTPPLQPFIDAALIGPKVDGVVLVVRAEKTDYRKVRQVVAQLQKAQALVLGTALNDVPLRETPYTAYGKYAERPLVAHREDVS